ncbi:MULTISPECIES: hypothetical protein [Bacillus cereus group]|uniref:hypothetical protein n=1 Tax=Bacillus cereus group TaxID=86661 RepID=UPI0007B6F127|nr:MULTISPECIES: hypothetical protein [Bacillus cereus group]ANC09225.1 hypothetical protein WR47_19640 [Bacillus cereus]ANC15042.1 hypothetical protein WR51_19640 [Bacillus cereus]MDA3651175.1 hypothetical protein [Bacillus cereus]PEV39934.1 hypothetical protein CN426_22460 [Bacillus thuringiensis]WPQ39581.1 hypothetical protein SH594_19660 [Bacillus cereus]
MKIFFSFLFAIAMLATFILLITSLVFRLKKKPNTKKYFKFTGIAFILSIISLIVVNMNMTPQEKQEILAKQKAEEKLKAEEKQKDKEQKEAEEKLKAEEKQKAKEQKEAEEKLKAEEKQKAKEQTEAEEKLKAQEEQKAKEKKEAEEKLKAEEKQKAKEQKEAEEKLKAEEKQKAKEQKEAEEQKKAEEKQKEFTSYAQNIRGGNFIKDMKLNNKDAEITFHDSFASYKSAKPDSNVTEEQYKQYFSTGDAIEKMFVSEPARLLRQFPDLNAVKMTLPFEGKTYNINLDRKSLNSHLEFKIEDLKVEDKSWVKKFNDPYVYNKAKRKAFFTKFVTVQ